MQQHIQAQIETAVRQTAIEEGGAGPLTKLITKLDELRDAGENVQVRLDPKTQKVTIVRLTEVTVPLSDLVGEEGDEEPHITPAFAEDFADDEPVAA